MNSTPYLDFSKIANNPLDDAIWLYCLRKARSDVRTNARWDGRKKLSLERYALGLFKKQELPRTYNDNDLLNRIKEYSTENLEKSPDSVVYSQINPNRNNRQSVTHDSDLRTDLDRNSLKRQLEQVDEPLSEPSNIVSPQPVEEEDYESIEELIEEILAYKPPIENL